LDGPRRSLPLLESPSRRPWLDASRRSTSFKRGLSPQVTQALARLATALWLAAIVWLAVQALLARVAHAADFPQDVGTGTLLIDTGAGFQASAPLATDVQVSIAGVVARVAVMQRFRNAGTGFIEAVYALPLPDDAAVDRLTMRIGDRVIEGEIREREQAERTYDAARAAGKRATLVRQKTANLFTTAVANLGPGEAVDITIEYLQTARYDNGELSLRLPLTYTERYGADSSEAAPKFDALAAATIGGGFSPGVARTDAAASSAGPAALEASVRVALAPGLPLVDVAARGHEMRVSKSRDVYMLETPSPTVPMDRDIVIAWRPAVGPRAAIAAFSETLGDTTYALLMMLPPMDARTWRTQPRELIAIVDTSGSMGGASIEQAKEALANALGRLTPADRFNVIEFNSETSLLYREPVPFTPESYGHALRFVAALQATGGTEMEPAIRAALEQPAAPGYLRQVIFLTDGAVADESRLFGTIKRELGDARLFTIGIGAAPNSYFMRKAAQFGRGTFTYVGDTAGVEDTMRELFGKLEHVALTDVVVDWPNAAELYPFQTPDLYAGEPLIVTASFPAGGREPSTVTAFGKAAGVPWQEKVEIAPVALHGIATLWARRKIEHALDSRVDGVAEELIRKIVLDVALEHRIVSPYTSFVAVDETPVRAADQPLAQRRIANVSPAGSTLGLPQTATPAPLLRALGLALVAAAAALWLRRRVAGGVR
jgi:Ca-activated chloride channel family protein